MWFDGDRVVGGGSGCDVTPTLWGEPTFEGACRGAGGGRGGGRGIRQCGVSSACGGGREHAGRPPKCEESAVGDTAVAGGCSVDKGGCRKWSGWNSSGTVPDPQIDPS